MFRLTTTENCRSGTRRILLEQIDASIALLQTREPSLEVAIHEARKNMKRVRAVLRLVRGDIGETIYRRENHRFRDAARQLAPLRDSAVMLETVDLLRARYAGDVSESAFANIVQWLDADYQRLRQRVLGDEIMLADVVDTWQSSRAAIEALPIENDDFHAFAYGVRRVYRQGKQRMNAAYANPPDSVRFHDWRKRVKYLWHQCEILHDLWPAMMAELESELHQVSDYLGDGHDLAVLAERLARAPEPILDDPERGLLIELADRHRAELEAAARVPGLRIYAESPRAFTARMAYYWQVWKLA